MNVQDIETLHVIATETHINFEQLAWATIDHDALKEVIAASTMQHARDWFTQLPSCSGLRNVALRRWEMCITHFDDASELIEFTRCFEPEVRKVALKCYLRTAKTVQNLTQVIIEAKDFPFIKRDALRKLVDVYCSEHTRR